jgi:proteinaceous RNase P
VFVDWLERNGPFDVMIDGANVALWGENYEGGAFRPDKIRVMYEAVLQQNPDAKVLLVRILTLPGGRIPAFLCSRPTNQGLLDCNCAVYWQQQHCLPHLAS